MARGLSGGALSGAVEGGLRSYQEKKNPLKTILQDTVIGGFAGLGFGAAGSNVQKWVKGKQLKSYGDNFDNLVSANKKKYFGLGKEYYKDNEQGVKTVADRVGEVKLSSCAINETNVQSPKHTKDVVNLSKNIRNAKYIGAEPEMHPHKKYDIKQFHRLRGKDVDYIIAENKKGDKYFYKMTDSALTGPKPEGQNLPSNIISQMQPKLKSFEAWLEDLKRKRGHK